MGGKTEKKKEENNRNIKKEKKKEKQREIKALGDIRELFRGTKMVNTGVHEFGLGACLFDNCNTVIFALYYMCAQAMKIFL